MIKILVDKYHIGNKQLKMIISTFDFETYILRKTYLEKAEHLKTENEEVEELESKLVSQ